MSREMILKVSDDVERWMDKHTKNAVYIFEGNRNETQHAWQRYKDHWKEELTGFLLTIGRLYDRPICISVSAFTLHGQQVFAYDPCSQLVDHDMIDEWLKHHFPTLMPEKGYHYRADGGNFHLIEHRALRMSTENAAKVPQ